MLWIFFIQQLAAFLKKNIFVSLVSIRFTVKSSNPIYSAILEFWLQDLIPICMWFWEALQWLFYCPRSKPPLLSVLRCCRPPLVPFRQSNITSGSLSCCISTYLPASKPVGSDTTSSVEPRVYPPTRLTQFPFCKLWPQRRRMSDLSKGWFFRVLPS